MENLTKRILKGIGTGLLGAVLGAGAGFGIAKATYKAPERYVIVFENGSKKEYDKPWVTGLENLDREVYGLFGGGLAGSVIGIAISQIKRKKN